SLPAGDGGLPGRALHRPGGGAGGRSVAGARAPGRAVEGPAPGPRRRRARAGRAAAGHVLRHRRLAERREGAVAMNVLVIGGGLAGAAAALSAQKAGARVLLVSRGPGATALSSGAADIAALEDAPILDAARALARKPGHPYALVGDLEPALADAGDVLRSL